MNKTSKILLTIIVIGLILSSINLIFQHYTRQNFHGFLIERTIYWITLIAIFGYALRKPLKKHRFVFFSTFTIFLFVQCSQIFESGNISTSKHIRLTDKYSIRSGATPFTLPTTSIVEINGIFEKEVSQRFVHIGNGEFELTSINSLDSIKLIDETKSHFVVRFYKDDKQFDQEMKKTVANNDYK